LSLTTSNFQPAIYYTEITREDRAIPNLATQLVLCIQNTICKGDKLIYTDGSKSGQGVGAAFYYPETDLSQGYALPIESSIFTAEAFAIIIAIKFILQQKYANFAILTDSKSVLQALQGNCLTSLTNWLIYDIKSRLQTGANLGKSIKLIWVPGHAEILGNEQADQKAKFMSKSLNNINLPLPYTDIIPYLKAKNIKLWEEKWEHIRLNTSVGGPNVTPWYRLVVPHFPNNPFTPWFHKKNLTKQPICISTRLRTGRSRFLPT
jgi:ribonuclease HI